MIDTHCHLLPGLDDGPKNVAESLELARELVAHGIDTVVCTPHWSRLFPTTHEDALEAETALRVALDGEGIPLQILLSAELSEVVAATRPLDEIRLRSIAGRVVIVELLAESLPVHVSAIVARLAAAGLTTVLAHPERSRAVQADPTALDSLRSAGVQAQIVAPSLTGRWGSSVETAAWTLLETERADLVASDAHDLGKRPCEIRAVRALVTERLGEDRWEALSRDAPRRLISGTVPPTP